MYLKCSICFNDYDEETFVPCIIGECAHTFCKSCIKGIITSSRKKLCPECREPIFPHKDIEKFRKNFALIDGIRKPVSIVVD